MSREPQAKREKMEGGRGEPRLLKDGMKSRDDDCCWRDKTFECYCYNGQSQGVTGQLKSCPGKGSLSGGLLGTTPPQKRWSSGASGGPLTPSWALTAEGRAGCSVNGVEHGLFSLR